MKNMNKIHLRSVFCGFLFLIGLTISVQEVHAQAQPPFNPAEIVKFDQDNTYSEFIEIINQFAQDYENRFIVDRSEYEGTIGVDLPAMHWKQALNFIIDFQGFELITNDTFYEIIIPAAAVEQAANAGGPVIPQIATTSTREVRISATFFEGNKRALREIGVDWSTLTTDVPADIGDFVFGEGRDAVPQTDFANDFVSVNSFGAQGVSQNVFNSLVNFGDLGTGISVQALFSAFEADNLGEIIATPFTKVIDGQLGKIQDGQDFSIKQRDFAGNVSDQFFSSGTILEVTPTIIEQGDTSFVHVAVRVERSSAQPDPVSTIINKQEAETSALLLDGESTVLAGLYRTEEARVRRGIPILKDIPILGYLFGFNSVDVSENELIIIIKVEIVESIPERYGQALKTVRQTLADGRQFNREFLDLPPKNIDNILPPKETVTDNAEDTTAVNNGEIADNTVNNDDTGNDTENTSDDPPVITQEEEKPKELTEEQKQAAKELSLPVGNPELMVVVPRAFDLDKYLENKEKGIEQPEIETNSDNLKYFVIGGSFIIPRNAYRLEDQFKSQGYDTRLLVNTQSRFHFVAYQGYSDIDDAIAEVRRLRASENSEAWLFVLDSPEKSIKE